MTIYRETEYETVSLTTSSGTTAKINVEGFSGVRLHFPSGSAPGAMTVYDLNLADGVLSDTGETISAPATAPSSSLVPNNCFPAAVIAITTTNDISSDTVTVVKKR